MFVDKFMCVCVCTYMFFDGHTHNQSNTYVHTQRHAYTHMQPEILSPKYVRAHT